MPGVFLMTGACLTDESFTLEAPGYPEIVWNATRLEHDAFHGCFGEPLEQRFDQLHDYGPDYDTWQHLDRNKVSWFTDNANRIVSKPDWRTKGLTTTSYKLIDIPGVTVALSQEDGLHGIPVDGNHRMKAREVMGLPTFHRFIVPPELEWRYRITLREI
jgi:hypothetical protein